MKNASNPQALRDLNKHRSVFDIDDVLRRRLGNVQRKPKDVCVGLADVNEARGNKGVDKLVELKLANAICIHRARFVADHGDLQTVPDLESRDQIDHLGVRFRLREHEAPKLIPCEGSLLVEDHPTQVFLERKLPLFMSFEDEAVPLFHLRPRQLEVLRSSSASVMIPTVGEQYSANIHKQAGDSRRFLHYSFTVKVLPSMRIIVAIESGRLPVEPRCRRSEASLVPCSLLVVVQLVPSRGRRSPRVDPEAVAPTSFPAVQEGRR